jgi:hypothetical protein
MGRARKTAGSIEKRGGRVVVQPVMFKCTPDKGTNLGKDRCGSDARNRKALLPRRKAGPLLFIHE